MIDLDGRIELSVSVWPFFVWLSYIISSSQRRHLCLQAAKCQPLPYTPCGLTINISEKKKQSLIDLYIIFYCDRKKGKQA